jgi:hypothetical protein
MLLPLILATFPDRARLTSWPRGTVSAEAALAGPSAQSNTLIELSSSAAATTTPSSLCIRRMTILLAPGRIVEDHQRFADFLARCDTGDDFDDVVSFDKRDRGAEATFFVNVDDVIVDTHEGIHPGPANDFEGILGSDLDDILRRLKRQE